MADGDGIRVLCVDDEAAILALLARRLAAKATVLTANGGAAGLETLKANPDIAVVISDMQMPGMSGAAFLRATRDIVPDAVRMLLTGASDLQVAVSAVNEGQIFRFLTKPCPPEELLKAFEAAVAQHRLITAERVLLEETLHGSILTLTDVLSITNPMSFSRASRLKRMVHDLADALGLRDRWQVEVAAMLSQLGWIVVPAETAERVYYGRQLTQDEQAMVDRVPTVTEQLLSHIPRLEAVRGILGTYLKAVHRTDLSPAEGTEAVVRRGAAILRAVVDYDALEARGASPAVAVQTLRGERERYAPDVLEALAALAGGTGREGMVQDVPLAGLRAGMVFAEDVKMQSGVLLAARGYEVTDGFVERARNFRGAVPEPLRILMPWSGRFG